MPVRIHASFLRYGWAVAWTSLVCLGARFGQAADAPQPAAQGPTQANARPAQSTRGLWRAFGRVTDPEGQPLGGVEVWAHCGIGTLRRTGTASSGDDGRYELTFGPGALFADKDGLTEQAALISAHSAGLFEENLNRQGACRAVPGTSTDERREDWQQRMVRVFAPDQPQEINFVMRPAGRVSGRLVDESGQPIEGYSVALQGADLPPGSNVIGSEPTDEQGRFALEDLPTTFRYQFVVRQSDPKPPWDDSWASAALRFERPESGDLRAWFGNREIRLDDFVLQTAGTGVHNKTAVPVAGNAGRLQLVAAHPDDVLQRSDSLLVVKSAVLTLFNSPLTDSPPTLVPESVPAGLARSSKFGLARTPADDSGEFTISFENPRGADLEPGRHQVIFQVFVGVSQNPVRERIFRQLEILPNQRYAVPIRIDPEFVADSNVSITFVTIQPEHDAWVKAFFQEGKGTKYSGLWISDGGLLTAIPFEAKSKAP